MNDETVHLPIDPLVEYLDRVHRRIGGDLQELALYCGVSVRGLSRYLAVIDDRVTPVSATIPLRYADEILTYAGDEAVGSLWITSDLDVNYRLPEHHARCKRCHIEVRKPAKLCGFCIEETTGKTLTYRHREIY